MADIIFYYGKDNIRGLLSEEDKDLALLKWAKHSGGYAHCLGVSREKYLHRIVLERILGRSLKKGELTDHIDGNRSDNRRSNLRLANHSMNNANSKTRMDNAVGYKGVIFQPGQRKKHYRPYISLNGKRTYFGYYFSLEEAARVYDIAAIKYFGEFARTNFPKEDYADNLL